MEASHLAIPGLRLDLLQQDGAVSFGTSGTRSIQRTTRLPLITSFSIFGWIKRLATPAAYQQIVTFGKNDASTDYYAIYIQPSETRLTIWNSSTESTQAGSITNGVWTHVGMTVAGTGSNQMILYQDGAAIFTGNGNATPAAGRILLDDAPDSSGAVFQGAYAWWTVHDRVLTPDEIKLLMRRPWDPALASGLNTVLRLNNESDPGLAAYGGDFTKNSTGFASTQGPPVMRPPVRRTWILLDPPAGAGITGTATGDAAPFAGAATGAETLTGTATGAEAAFSAAATGTNTANLGTASAASAPFAATGAGSETFTGTASTAASPNAATGSGTETITGTGAAAMRSPAATGSDATLVPLVQYRIDEAASGQAPTQLFDSQPTPLNLAINYVGGTPAFGADSNGRYLGFSGNVDQAVAASVALDTGNKVFDAIDGNTEATLEVVADLTFPQSVSGDISNIFGIGQDDGENDVIQLWLWEGSQQHIEVDFTTSAGYPSGYYKRSGDIADLPSGPTIFHCIFDTDNATEADRIRLYVTPIGGSRSRITLATSNDGTASIPQHAQIDVPTPNNSGGPTGPNHTQHVLIGNWKDYFGGNGGLKGKVYYAAIYDKVLTGAEMDAAGGRIGDVLNSAAAAASPFAAAATGTETFTGTGTAAASPAAVTATGAETFAAAASAAMASPSSSAVGAETFAGAAAPAMASFAVTAAALETFVATATAAAQAFAANAGGDGIFSGGASVAAAPFAASATAAETFTGAATAALASFGASSSGTETMAGSAAASAAAFSAVSTALETFVAVAAADVAAFQASGLSGGVTGSGGVAMASFGAVAAAAEAFNGAITAATRAFAASGAEVTIPPPSIPVGGGPTGGSRISNRTSSSPRSSNKTS